MNTRSLPRASVHQALRGLASASRRLDRMAHNQRSNDFRLVGRLTNPSPQLAVQASGGLKSNTIRPGSGCNSSTPP